MKHAFLALTLVAGVIMATSCSKPTTEIEHSLDFILYTTPTSNTITEGQTIEIACELHKSYLYADNAVFTLQLEQVAGSGELTMEGEEVKPNTTYTVPKGKFTLYYTALGNDHHAIKLTVTDQLNNHEQTTIQFTNL